MMVIQSGNHEHRRLNGSKLLRVLDWLRSIADQTSRKLTPLSEHGLSIAMTMD